ncbi:MAG: hypothetical protein ACLUE2_10435 [Bacteroides cellulosilyticus]
MYEHDGRRLLHKVTLLREQIQLTGEWESSLGTCRLPGTTDETDWVKGTEIRW